MTVLIFGKKTLTRNIRMCFALITGYVNLFFLKSVQVMVRFMVILLRGDPTETGRRTMFRDLRHLRRWNVNVNRRPKATEALPPTQTDVITR